MFEANYEKLKTTHEILDIFENHLAYLRKYTDSEPLNGGDETWEMLALIFEPAVMIYLVDNPDETPTDCAMSFSKMIQEIADDILEDESE